MIVQCPSCSKRYRVNDANIPPSGGKIRCPECSHSFVVYPESDSGPQETHEPGEKTQVAQRPNMEELLKGMQQAGGAGGASGDEAEGAATEVMSGAELPDFNNLFGEAGGDDDATMEVPNPLHPSNLGGGGSAPEDDLQTQEMDSDISQKMGQVRNVADSSPPIDGLGGGDDAATQITPPSHLGDIPSPRDSQTPAGSPPDPSPAPPDRQRASVPDGPTPPPGQNPAPAADSSPGSGQFGATSSEPSSPGIEAPTSAAASAAGGGAASAGGPDPDHNGPWKLKTNFGLTYEFADNDSLREWLDGRDELDGYELSADDDNFYPLQDFPQVQGSDSGGDSSGSGRQMPSSGTQPPMPGRSGSSPGAVGSQKSGPQPASPGPGRTPSSVGGSGPAPPLGAGANGGGHSPFQTAAKPAVGGGPAPASTPASAPQNKKEKINPDEKFTPPSRDSKALSIVLWGAFLMLMAAAVVLLLDIFDVIDIPLFGDEEGDTEAVVAQEELPEEAVAEEQEEPEPEEVDDEEVVGRLLEEAQEDINANRLGPALEQLEEAAELDSERAEIYELKAVVHEEFGDGDEADAMREQAEQLRAEQQGDEGEEVPGEEDGG